MDRRKGGWRKERSQRCSVGIATFYNFMARSAIAASHSTANYISTQPPRKPAWDLREQSRSGESCVCAAISHFDLWGRPRADLIAGEDLTDDGFDRHFLNINVSYGEFVK